MNIHCCCSTAMLLIVFQLATRGARTFAASDEAPVEQPGSNKLQLEALEGIVDEARQTVKPFWSVICLRFLQPATLWRDCLHRCRWLQMKRWTSWSAAGAGRPGRPTTWEGTPSETSKRFWTVSWINLKQTCGTSQFGMESETVGNTV